MKHFPGISIRWKKSGKNWKGSCAEGESLEQKMFQKILKGQQADRKKSRILKCSLLRNLRNAAGKRILMDLKDFSGNRKPRWSRRSKTEKQIIRRRRSS